MIMLAPAIAQAAMETGVATRPITDIKAYRDQLTQFVFQSVMVMRPVFERAKNDPKRIVYAEGEDHKILRAVQSLIDERLVIPILVGRPQVIDNDVRHLGLRIRPGRDFEVIDPGEQRGHRDNQEDQYVNTLVAAGLVREGRADGMICGRTGQYHGHLRHVEAEFGLCTGVKHPAAMNIILFKKGVYFICDTAVTENPTSEQLAENTLLAADYMKKYSITPRAALLSFSNNGDFSSESVNKMKQALRLIRSRDPELHVDGQMRADAALLESIRRSVLPDSSLEGQANLLIMPNLDAAKIAYDIIKVLGEAITIGPILLGMNYPVQILTPSATVRRILNNSALVAVDAQDLKRGAAGTVPVDPGGTMKQAS